MIRIRVTMVAVILAVIATPAHAKWLRADTESFIIYSESNEKQLREFAANLQRFDTTLRVVFNVAAKGEESRLPIYLLPGRDDVARLATGSRSAPVSGFYRQDRDGSFALSHRQNDGTLPGTSPAQQVLFHEYSHHFMKRHLRVAFPGWFIEGFAEYYSTVDFDKEGRAMVGQPAHRRAYGLLMLPKMPAERVLFEPPSAMRSRGQTDVYYGRSWLLTHMLFHDPARANQINAYTNAINAGTEPRKAATDAFGDLAQLDKDLNRYVEGRLSYRTTRDPVPVSTAIKITPLSADEDAVMMLRIERMNARADQARLTKVRDDLRALAAKLPANPDLQYELAAAEWDIAPATRDLTAMRAALEKLLAARPEHVRGNVLLGQLQLHQLRQKGETDPAAWKAARRPIQIANRADPNDPIPLHAYFQSFLTERTRPSDMAIKGLERAFALTPENLNLRSAYAVSLAHLGRFEPAINLAKTVAFDPHDNGRGDALLKRIETMRDRGAAAAPEAEDDDGEG